MKPSVLTFIAVICLVVLTDFFVFPIGLQAMPGVNTKMLMAVGGLGYMLLNPRNLVVDFINKNFISLSLWACAFSLVCLTSVIWNSTSDYTYTTYVVSMFVWLFAAFLLINLMQSVHGYISVQLLTNYLIAVGVIQCASALLLEYNTSFFDFVENHQLGMTLLFDTEERLQGIAAALDPAGIRFAAILVMLGYVTVNHSNWDWLNRIIYLSSFIFITMAGNMMARTTTVGAVLVIFYWGYTVILGRGRQRKESVTLFSTLIMILIALTPVISFYYNVDAHFRDNLRFGFEGFFSLAENGKWEVSSNEILKSMIKFPESLKTWLIGDGYIENPSNGVDPYYVGEHYQGFYMNTDIGYLRFIFYCGVIGLITFIGFFIDATKCAIDRVPKDKTLPILLLLLNFIIWLKVSTDIFQFFALLLSIPPSFDKENNDIVSAKVLIH